MKIINWEHSALQMVSFQNVLGIILTNMKGVKLMFQFYFTLGSKLLQCGWLALRAFVISSVPRSHCTPDSKWPLNSVMAFYDTLALRCFFFNSWIWHCFFIFLTEEKNLTYLNVLKATAYVSNSSLSVWVCESDLGTCLKASLHGFCIPCYE